MRYLLGACAALAVSGCFAGGPPRFAEGERECLARLEAEEDRELIRCGGDAVCVDRVMDLGDQEAERCLESY